MDRLIEGYKRFRAHHWEQQRARFELLADHGQHPAHMVITCSDSRVDPARIFDSAPGEMFVVRNVASLVPPYEPDGNYHGTSAALEFGVTVLRVRHLIVMGHALCGGVRALLGGPPPQAKDFVALWMNIAEPARRRALAHESPEMRQQLCELDVVRLSLTNLMTFPWVREAVEEGRMQLHGSYFDVRSGILKAMGADGTFTPVSAS